MSKTQGVCFISKWTLHAETVCVTKLVMEINSCKPSGPNDIPCRLLKERANEHTTIISILFKQHKENIIRLEKYHADT